QASVNYDTMPPTHESLNNLRAFLLGGPGAPEYAPEGLLALRGMSVEQLARASNITRTAVYFYIEGTSRPTARTLRSICTSLDVRFERGLEFCTPATTGRPPNGRSPAGNRLGRPSEKLTARGDILQTAPGSPRLKQYESNSRSQGDRRIFQQEIERRNVGPSTARRSGAVPVKPEQKEADIVPSEANVSGLFAQELSRLMREHDPPLDIKALAYRLEMCYENGRKLV